MGSKTGIGARMIETACGLFIDPLDPDPAAFRLTDIGHALSLVCRFQGHTTRHYSVAEHSLLVADVLEEWGCDKRTILAGIMHDASEAYIADLASPIKRDPTIGDAYRAIEDRIMSRLAERFGFDWPLPQEVHAADMLLLWCEAHVLMHSGGTTWGNYETEGKWRIEQNPLVCKWVHNGKLIWHHSEGLEREWVLRALNAGAL